MKTPLIHVAIQSCYRSRNGLPLLLPARIARCTPDTAMALVAIRSDVEATGGHLRLLDLYRTHEVQLRSYLDYTSGRKRTASPPPGESMHEGGRAFDLDPTSLGMSLDHFVRLAAAHGVEPIVQNPDMSASEAWHFERRGSHDRVREYYAARRGTNMGPYAAMATSAILACGLEHDHFTDREREAQLQALLIRLGYDPGNIDGHAGARTLAALATAGIHRVDLDDALAALEEQAQSEFPDEYCTPELVPSASAHMGA